MNSRRLIQAQQGSVVVEFALLAPLMLLLMVVLLESARLLYQASTIEKHLYAASELAAHSALPLDTATTAIITNMAQRGSTDMSQAFLVPGWSDASANFDIAISYYDLNGEPIPVITLSSSVPYVPILDDLGNALGLSEVVLEHHHAQIIH